MFEKIKSMFWEADKNWYCNCCGAPIPDCYSLCYACSSSEKKRGLRIRELENKVNKLEAEVDHRTSVALTLTEEVYRLKKSLKKRLMPHTETCQTQQIGSEHCDCHRREFCDCSDCIRIRNRRK